MDSKEQQDPSYTDPKIGTLTYTNFPVLAVVWVAGWVFVVPGSYVVEFGSWGSA